MRFLPSSRVARGQARLMRKYPSPARRPYIVPLFTYTRPSFISFS